MKIIINDNLDGTYSWELYDGPDGVDYASGDSKTLKEALEEIEVARLEIAQGYY